MISRPLTPYVRFSPVPNHTFHTYRFLYTERFSMVLPVSSHLPWSSPCAPRLDFPNLLFSEQFIYDTAEFTLCYGLYACSPSFENFIHPLSTLHYCNAPDLATRLTGDYRGRTHTDRHGPASLDTRTPT